MYDVGFGVWQAFLIPTHTHKNANTTANKQLPKVLNISNENH